MFRWGLVRIGHPLKRVQGSPRRSWVLSWNGIQGSWWFRICISYLLMAFVSNGVRTTPLHHLYVRWLSFAKIFHAVHIEDAILRSAELLLRRLCALLQMVLAQHGILHSHHVPIGIHPVYFGSAQRRAEVLRPLELDVRGFGLWLHVKLCSVAVHDALSGQALHLNLFQLVWFGESHALLDRLVWISSLFMSFLVHLLRLCIQIVLVILLSLFLLLGACFVRFSFLSSFRPSRG